METCEIAPELLLQLDLAIIQYRELHDYFNGRKWRSVRRGERFMAWNIKVYGPDSFGKSGPEKINPDYDIH